MRRKKSSFLKRLLALMLAFAFFFSGAPMAPAKILMYTPDGRIIHLKGGTAQPDISEYRSPLESKILDRTFYTGPATFLANEG